MFEKTMSDFYLDLWLQHLPEAARPQARDHAREFALAHPNLSAAATVLLKLDDPAAAEARLLAEPGRIDGTQYGSLVPLAKALRNHDCPRGETVIYRALLKGILDRAYARAYGHAARYWSRLQEIANGTSGLLPLSTRTSLLPVHPHDPPHPERERSRLPIPDQQAHLRKRPGITP